MSGQSAKDKNRMAQRAYRERQKERQRATDQQVEELTERVSALHRENALLESALEAARSRDEEGQTTAAAEADTPVVVLHLGKLPHIQLSRQEVAALTLETLAEIWKKIAQALSLCIAEAERNPGSHLRRRAETIAEEACALIWVLMDHNPQLMEELTHTNLEALGVPLSTSASAALSTVMDLSLTAQQEVLLLETRHALLSNLRALTVERNDLCGQLNSLVDVEEHPGGAVSNYMHISDIVRQMQKKVDAMHACHSYYISHAYAQILTPIQIARFIVQSYPFGPDLMRLLTALAERQPGGVEAVAVPPSDQPSSSAGPTLPSDWHIAQSLPISQIRKPL